ncbi:LOW QUALITY PROTEIN: torsin-1B-like [Cariama cristata]
MKLPNAAVFFIFVPTLTPALDPLSISVFMGSAAVTWQLLSPHSWLKCSLPECCNMKDKLNFAGWEDIPVKEPQSLLSAEIFSNRKSGFFHSLIQKNLIAYFNPFLPLKCKHVRERVREELRIQGHPEDEDLITEIALAMTECPSEERLYSSKGCKTVGSRVTLSMRHYQAERLIFWLHHHSRWKNH